MAVNLDAYIYVKWANKGIARYSVLFSSFVDHSSMSVGDNLCKIYIY